MHDGSVDALRGAVELYDEGHPEPYLWMKFVDHCD